MIYYKFLDHNYQSNGYKYQSGFNKYDKEFNSKKTNSSLIFYNLNKLKYHYNDVYLAIISVSEKHLGENC